MAKKYYALYTIENGEEKLQGVVSHEEMVQLLPIFSESRSRKIKRNFYTPIAKSCAQKLGQSLVGKLLTAK